MTEFVEVLLKELSSLAILNFLPRVELEKTLSIAVFQQEPQKFDW